jgi:hypothetical protein
MTATTGCPWQPTLSYISHIFGCTLSLTALSLSVPIYRLQWQLLLLICQQWLLHQEPSLTLKGWPIYFPPFVAFFLWQWQSSSSRRWAADASLSMDGAVHWWLLHINGNNPNNHSLCHWFGAIVLLLLQHMLAFSRSSKLTILRASLAKFPGTCHTFQSPESLKHPFVHSKGSLQPDGLWHLIWRVFNVCLWNNIPLQAYQPCLAQNDLSSLTSRLTTPPQMNISKCDIHWVF